MIADDNDCCTGNQGTQEQTGVDATVIAVCQGRIGSSDILSSPQVGCRSLGHLRLDEKPSISPPCRPPRVTKGSTGTLRELDLTDSRDHLIRSSLSEAWGTYVNQCSYCIGDAIGST